MLTQGHTSSGAILLILWSCLCLTACGDSPEDPSGSNTSTPSSGQDMFSASHDMSSSASHDSGVYEDYGQQDMASFDPFMDMASSGADMAPVTQDSALTSSHTRVEFARASASYSQTRHVTLRHAGDVAITLAPVSTSVGLDSDMWRLEWVHADGTTSPALSSSATLEPEETLWLRLVHTSSNVPAEEVTRDLTINVQDRPELSLALAVVTDMARPCLDVLLPAAASTMGPAYMLDLGALDAQEMWPQGFSLTNCGPTYPVQISDVYVSRNPYGLLGLPETSRELPGNAMLLEPEEARFIEISTASPTQPLQVEEPFHIGQLTALTDAAGLETFNVTMRAQPTSQTCPRADARVIIAGSSQPATLDTLDTTPLDTVRLEALHDATSTRPAGMTASWSILSKPTTSHTSLRAAAAGAGMTADDEALRRELFLDVPGEYIVEFETFAIGEQTSCQSDRVVITATPTHDLYISTTWETPLDPDPTDRQGADLDLHYLHPEGSFEDALYDVFWRNRSADWGAPGAHDDPVLLRDDRDGFGPEVIAHDSPEADQTYRIGVHYFDPAGFGSSYVSTTIHVRGQLAATSISQHLPAQGSYLKVGQVTWSPNSPQVVLEDAVLLSPPR